MSRREEFVGCRVIDHVESDGPHWSQWLTDEPIVRCRDCENYSDHGGGGVCCCPLGDATAGRAWAKPDGFCAWGKRRDDGQA